MAVGRDTRSVSEIYSEITLRSHGWKSSTYILFDNFLDDINTGAPMSGRRAEMKDSKAQALSTIVLF